MKTDGMSEDEINKRHADKMAKKKAARDKMIAKKTLEKGLLMIHTGKGKGKTTAAMGLALRAVGNGMKVCIIQFVKGVWNTGEREILKNYPNLCIMKAMGEGFTWDTQDRARDVAAAENAWNYALEAMQDESIKMLVLDELNIVLRYDYLDFNAVLEALKNKRPDLHIVITGRNAKEELIEIADMVTEMAQIKHHFRGGVKAQIGVEF